MEVSHRLNCWWNIETLRQSQFSSRFSVARLSQDTKVRDCLLDEGSFRDHPSHSCEGNFTSQLLTA